MIIAAQGISAHNGRHSPGLGKASANGASTGATNGASNGSATSNGATNGAPFLPLKTAKRPRRVAVLIDTTNSYSRGVLEGIGAAIRRRRGWFVDVVQSQSTAATLAWLKEWHGDGLIAQVEDTRVAAAIADASHPVVDISPLPTLAGKCWVGNDEESIARVAVDHLLERHFKSIAFIGDAGLARSTARLQAVAAYLHAKGLVCNEYLLPLRAAGSLSSVQADRLAAWLHGLPRPLGVIAGADFRGQQILQVCRAENIPVPKQVAVMGMDNDELLCNLATPALTSVIPNARQVGETAAGLLAALLDGKGIAQRRHAIPPVGIAIRPSTDIVVIDDRDVAAAARFIYEHAYEGINVKHVVKAVSVSRRVLENRFQKWFGRTIHAEIERIKIERIKQLLADTDLKICEIAEQVGFQYTESMNVAFKRAVGERPGEYRRRRSHPEE